jgi:peptidoglycan/xylan/chitin deacetylase (PgdA/CDA1 family)
MKTGNRIIKWDVNSYDYKNIETEKLVANVLGNVKNGSIILFHDYADNQDALKILVPELKKRYQLVTVSELLKFK